MNRKFKNILILVIGIIIGSTICVIGSNVISANQVGINSSKTTKTNIQDAIDELYDKANSMINIPKTIGATVVTSGLPKGVKAIVYLDPTDLSKSCNASNSVSISETKTGCMKWYAYENISVENKNIYTMILDHNTTAKSYYNYEGTNTSMGTRSASELTTEKGTTINYNEIGYDLQQLTSTSGWKVTPRLITAQEIANITGNIEWTLGGSGYHFEPNCAQINSSGPNIGLCAAGTNPYAWLFSYLGHTQWAPEYLQCTSFGCYERAETSYYWTNTAYTSNSNNVWFVSWGGYLGSTNANSTSQMGLGLRPVITILK